MIKDNITTVLAKFTQQLSHTISTQDIYDELLSHPDYPSLLSISEVLTNFNITNSAVRIEHDELTNIPCPFIAYNNSKNGDFILVNKMERNHVFISNEKWNRHKISLDNFKKSFSGIILTAEAPTKSKADYDYLTVLKKLRWPFASVGLILILFSALTFHTDYFISFNWPVGLITLFKSAGLMTSLLLLWQSIDSNNVMVQKVCKSGGKVDCNSILSSKAATVFQGLTWSEVGFFYFAGTWLLLLFGGHSNSLMQILSVLNIMGLPYTFYSIYYQARVAKRWCVFCCIIQALLWSEFGPLVTYFHSPFELPGYKVASSIFIALLLPVILWVILKPLFLLAQKVHPLKQQLQQFKYNSEIFANLLTKQPKYIQPDEDWSIVLGNIKANNILTLVTNPFCAPCAKTHYILHQLLDQRPDLQARILFKTTGSEDERTHVSRHMMTLYGLNDKSIVKQALNDWYEQREKNYDSWAKSYPVQLGDPEINNKIDIQKAWCRMADINATPTILLNGHLLPDSYQLSNLKYMLN
jgi:uncharacterized membrane protein